MDVIGNYYYNVVISPAVKRVRYSSIQYNKLLFASTSTDTKGIVTELFVQSIVVVDTDLTTWEGGVKIAHGYGSADVDIKVGVQFNALSLQAASIFMCSNAIGPNLVVDDPLTVINESKTDSKSSTILNPGIYLD